MDLCFISLQSLFRLSGLPYKNFFLKKLNQNSFRLYLGESQKFHSKISLNLDKWKIVPNFELH